MHGTAVVHVGQRRPRAPEHLQHVRNVLCSKPARMRGYRFTGYPAPQIPRPTSTLTVARPVVIRRWHRGMIPMREVSGFRGEPIRVQRIWCADECEGAAQCVDDFL